MNVDRTGAFLVEEIDRALGATKIKGLPQLVVRVRTLHWYDQGKETWVDYSETGMEIDCYLLLMYEGKEGFQTSFHYDNIMKVYGWDGRDFQDLVELPAPGIFMIKVKENDPEYADKNPFVVDRIDDKDADPVGGLKKLDAAGVKDLQAQFGALMSKAGKPVTAAKAPPKAPKTATKPTAAEKKAAKAEKSKRIAEANAKLAAAPSGPEPPVVPKTATPPAVPTATPPAADEAPPADATPYSGMTKQEAFDGVLELQDKECTEDQRTAAWHAAIKEVTGGTDETTVTDAQWHEIMTKTLDDIGKF